MTLSGAIDPGRAQKVKVRPVSIRGQLYFQETLYRENKVFHSNHQREEMLERLLDYMDHCFRQAQMRSGAREATVLVGKKGKVSIRCRNCPEDGAQKQKTTDLSHDRRKHYILQEGQPVDFLVEHMASASWPKDQARAYFEMQLPQLAHWKPTEK